MRKSLLSACLLALPLVAGATLAQQTMTEPQVRALLAENGYTDIDDIDFEDGMWEADATSADGKRVDVRVNPSNGNILADAQVSRFSEADIKARLAAAGYSRIHDVDFDDGIWKAEADNANGDDVEIHLDPQTGEIIHVEDD
ncbi:PepSY domain-containing protein [Pseudoxanthomonas mexicana]|uniref:PepSY domain-containing protein n=1 Tax=Pseudoxanthomonas mexicana TaxID=128785 RepID=UPI00398B19F1